MKQQLSISAAAVIAASILNAQSQNWITADTVAYPAIGPSGQVDDLAAASDGNIYAIGASIDSSGGFSANWVRRSSDAGNSWQSIASFAPVTGNGINKLAVDSTGRLYAAGLSSGIWTVLSSTDQGQNWAVADSFATAGSFPEVRDIAADASGAVYVVGGATPARSPRQWLVRKGVPNGNSVTWTTVDAYSVDRTYGAYATCLALKSSASGVEVVVAGAVGSSSGLNWLVRRSTDGGASWVTSDRLISGIDGAQTLAIAPDGSIFTSGKIRTIAGTKKNPTSVTSFVVRKGVPSAGTISWSTQQTIPESASYTAFVAQSSVADRLGRVFFAGYDVTRSDNFANYRVHVSVDGGQTLSETDVFVGAAFCVTTDVAGEIFTGGYFGSSMTNGGGIIRKLVTPTP